MRLLVGYDGREGGSAALALARDLIGETGGGHLVVAVIDEVDPLSGGVGMSRAPGSAHLERCLSRAAEELGGEDFQRRTSAGPVPALLGDIAEEEGAEMIVVGSTERGRVGRALPGSVGRRLLSSAGCPIAVAPRGYGEHEHPPKLLIGIGYDGDESSRLALDFADRLAAQLGAAIRLILASDVVPEGGWREREDLECVVMHGDPAAVLEEQTVELDLLVLGSRGRGPLHALLAGSVAGTVIDAAACPVIAVPSGARISDPLAPRG